MDVKLAHCRFYLIHLIVVVITLACLLMNGPMRGGLPLDNSVSDRMVFIAENTALWSLSWFIWMLSALGLFVFCALFADLIKQSAYRGIGLALVGMGIPPDLIAEVIYAFILPQLIVQEFAVETFQLLETLAMHLTGFLGNGLYNLGGLLLTVLALRQHLLPRWVAIWGLVSWCLGLLLSVSVAISSMRGAELFTASSMLMNTSWMLILAYRIFPR